MVEEHLFSNSVMKKAAIHIGLWTQVDKKPHQMLHLPSDVLPHDISKCLDDDGRPKRTGTVWTASAHIITSIIGSGVLSLAWAVAQLGWIGGPTVILMFAVVMCYTSSLLADCYRSGDPISGKRNYTYMEVVQSNLGGAKVKICGIIQYCNLFGITVGYTIATSVSMMAVMRSNCFHRSGNKNPCHESSNPYMIMFGIIEIVLSQIPDFDQIWWLSILASIMSFTYSSIGLGLGVSTVAANGTFKGTLTGISIGTITRTQKLWKCFQALANIAFSYCYSFVLVEIQDTIKSPPSEATTMKKANLISVAITTSFYMLCGCMGYAALGDQAPGNLLTEFGFRDPFWLIDIANIAIVIHLVGAYQVFSQPIFAFIEKWLSKKCPSSTFITKEIKVPIPCWGVYNLNLFRLVWRSAFVMVTTLVSMLLPFFNDVLGIIGAFAFWPLAVYFPVEMYIAQRRIPKWGVKWTCFQMLSLACLMISIVAGIGSIAGVVTDLRAYQPFKTRY
ncbi:amino acid permease 4-like isoform X1 [Vitis riparia]|uniref:amino acid permease 4-like isoform X1 n=1 Tax=Vitis riparia TaxID=96939 RepID=UPI00155A4E1B|nr:amino acid permease 4-like isoform X1 [Vitis riparia]XP_034691284.1 amino acid permease 4-like isoform X1 [Vitis riparia]XP_034691285.1 amino acid permease 4-like isoform X1 [Vitis riparia]XP_034691286.1 amino acid permease 4-like isoform X1 [Vitis riparia]